MDLEEAIKNRHSVRIYKTDRIDDDVAAELQKEIDAINQESGLCISLVRDEPKTFNGLLFKTVVKFKNAVNYFSVSGPVSEDLEEKCGYYGERLVLFAQMIGLNTCWALMASKKEASKGLPDGYRNVISISVGYGENQGVPHKNKPIEDVADLKDAPDWFVKGVECAMTAPTGMNKQGFKFERDGNNIRMITGNSTLAKIDRGIVKYHFELGAGKDNFSWIE